MFLSSEDEIWTNAGYAGLKGTSQLKPAWLALNSASHGEQSGWLEGVAQCDLRDAHRLCGPIESPQDWRWRQRLSQAATVADG